MLSIALSMVLDHDTHTFVRWLFLQWKARSLSTRRENNMVANKR